jgi:ribosomal protein S18 acetylase RimI-like enzyme
LQALDQADTQRWIERAVSSIAIGWEAVAEPLGGPVVRSDDVWLADSASPNPFLNAATLRRPMSEHSAEALTARMEAFFAARDGGPWLLWSGWPTPALDRLGYVLWGHPPIMVRPPGGQAPPPPPELRIVEVRDAITLATVERLQIDHYPMLGLQDAAPGCLFNERSLGGPFQFLAGYVDDQLVSTAASLLVDDILHVDFVATRTDARRRGYGTALTWAATLADPTRPAILEASDDGRPVYERMGYREVARMSLWERPRDLANPVYSPYAPISQ